MLRIVLKSLIKKFDYKSIAGEYVKISIYNVLVL